MAVALKLSAGLIENARPHAAAMHRSVPQQIEHWAWLGKTVEENPELPVQFIQDTLLALEEVKAGLLTEYQLSSKRNLDDSVGERLCTEAARMTVQRKKRSG